VISDCHPSEGGAENKQSQELLPKRAPLEGWRTPAPSYPIVFRCNTMYCIMLSKKRLQLSQLSGCHKTIHVCICSTKMALPPVPGLQEARALASATSARGPRTFSAGVSSAASRGSAPPAPPPPPLVPRSALGSLPDERRPLPGGEGARSARGGGRAAGGVQALRTLHTQGVRREREQGPGGLRRTPLPPPPPPRSPSPVPPLPSRLPPSAFSALPPVLFFSLRRPGPPPAPPAACAPAPARRRPPAFAKPTPSRTSPASPAQSAFTRAHGRSPSPALVYKEKRRTPTCGQHDRAEWQTAPRRPRAACGSAASPDRPRDRALNA
jgi:hypothetical protein